MVVFKAVDFSSTQFKYREQSNLDLRKTHDTSNGHPLRFLLFKRDGFVVFFIKSYDIRIKMRTQLNVRFKTDSKCHFSSITHPIIKICIPQSAKCLGNLGLNTSTDGKVVTIWDGLFRLGIVLWESFFPYMEAKLSLKLLPIDFEPSE